MYRYCLKLSIQFVLNKFNINFFCCCKGTGSTSWCYNINKMSLNSIKKIIKLVNKEAGKDIPEDDTFVNNVTNKFNDSLLFGAEDLKIAYTIRDPIINSKFDNKYNK